MNPQTTKKKERRKERRSADSNSDDEVAIRRLYQQMMDGWNSGSGDAFAAPFTDDSDLIGSRLVGKARSIRFLHSNIAIMIAVGGTVMAGQSDIEPERNSIHSLVAIKREGKWKFTAFQNSRAQYIGRPEESQKLTEELRRELSISNNEI